MASCGCCGVRGGWRARLSEAASTAGRRLGRGGCKGGPDPCRAAVCPWAARGKRRCEPGVEAAGSGPLDRDRDRDGGDVRNLRPGRGLRGDVAPTVTATPARVGRRSSGGGRRAAGGGRRAAGGGRGGNDDGPPPGWRGRAVASRSSVRHGRCRRADPSCRRRPPRRSRPHHPRWGSRPRTRGGRRPPGVRGCPRPDSKHARDDDVHQGHARLEPGHRRSGRQATRHRQQYRVRLAAALPVERHGPA